MACVVCLVADARGMRACSCNTRIHVQCLAGLLDHNFQRCTVCLQTFTPEAVLAARRSQLSQPEIFETLMDFCSAATSAGRDVESMAIFAILAVASTDTDCLGDVDLAQYLYERGRCLAQRKRFAVAEKDFEHAVTLLRRHPECPTRQIGTTLTALAGARIDQNKLCDAAGSLWDAVLLTPRLPAEVVQGLMRVVARYCLARGDLRRHAEALTTIHDIACEECPCPVGRATAYLEMKLGQAAACEEVLDESGTFQASLRTLRRSRSRPELVEAASRLSISQCPPKKRIRVKTHAEDSAV